MARVAQDSFDEHDDDQDGPDTGDDGSALSDREDPDPSDQDGDGEYDDDDDDDETVPCPYCRKPVFEGAELCPHCKSYISIEDTPPRRVALWIWAGVILCLLVVLIWALLPPMPG
jgi:hypothetical protein